ncbi:hypothetical protein ACOUKR_08910 [Acinetobacter baumannii]|uniref:hypothetical protein n=1 Tax=Acinetobacter baumannii TaxID=470 RepID=UPI002446F479|nr:hypothetical protein [Acinetobacter baumannii]MDH2626501.1 hypothetical protein [Acinetobacter baumannii]
MRYIVKLTESDKYLIPDNEGWLTTTDSKEKAVEIGQIHDEESAELTAHSFSGGMITGVDFIIEKV